MGVAVLHPQDCLPKPSRQGLLSHPPPPPLKFPRNPNPNHRGNRPQNNNRRKRSPNTSPPARAASSPSDQPNNLMMGQVKILKRGEQLTQTTSQLEKKHPKQQQQKPVKAEKVEMKDLDLGSTTRLGPDPKSVPTQIRLADGFYAGSAFFSSPPPSSLPLPAFFMKKSSAAVKKDNDAVATSDLRRLLGLSL